MKVVRIYSYSLFFIEFRWRNEPGVRLHWLSSEILTSNVSKIVWFVSKPQGCRGSNRSNIVFDDSHGNWGQSDAVRDTYVMRYGQRYFFNIEWCKPLLKRLVYSIGIEPTHWAIHSRSLRTVSYKHTRPPRPPSNPQITEKSPVFEWGLRIEFGTKLGQ